MVKNFRLAVGQSPAELSSPRLRLEWLRDALPDLQSQKVDLLLLPELFVSGYNIGEKINEWAEASDGPFATEIAAMAGQFGVAICYGYAERAEAAIFNSAQCFGPNGIRLGSHRKLLLPPGFEQDYFTHGTHCRLFTYRGLQVGILICYDIEFPETARHVAALGADLILAPTALGAQWDWVGSTLIPARGYENGVFLAYANQAGSENGMEFLGKSFISGPDGEELARAGAAPEVIISDLELSRVSKAQARLPYLVDRKRLRLSVLENAMFP